MIFSANYSTFICSAGGQQQDVQVKKKKRQKQCPRQIQYILEEVSFNCLTFYVRAVTVSDEFCAAPRSIDQ